MEGKIRMEDEELREKLERLREKENRLRNNDLELIKKERHNETKIES